MHVIDTDFTQKIIFSDEATFFTNGNFNHQNFRYWAPDNPHWMGDLGMQNAEKILVWAGIFDNQIVGPFLLRGNVTADNYLHMLQTLVMPSLQRLPTLPEFFQQDGAPPHYATTVRQFLDGAFPGCWIGRAGPITWPARSPDLTPCDYFLWGYVKHEVYKTRIQSLNHLEQRIFEVFESIPEGMLQNVLDHWVERLEACEMQGGHHIEHLL